MAWFGWLAVTALSFTAAIKIIQYLRRPPRDPRDGSGFYQEHPDR